MEPAWLPAAFAVVAVVAAALVASSAATWRRRRAASSERVSAMRRRLAACELRQDRLLQGFNGVLFLVQAAHDSMAEHPAKATEILDQALRRGDLEIRAVRLAMQPLRDDVDSSGDIFDALVTLGLDLVRIDGDPLLRYRVLQEGAARTLRPLFLDDVRGLVRMAVRSARRHGRPTAIEVQLAFRTEDFRVLVRDDGQGLSPSFDSRALAESSALYRSLSRVQARTGASGGRFKAWSGRQAGTELELSFSARRAYSDNLTNHLGSTRQPESRRWKR